MVRRYGWQGLYWICPYCGASLDPDEHCTCRNKPEKGAESDFKQIKPTEVPMGDLKTQYRAS